MANLVTRPDTFFGVCEAIGQDLGFHPNLLRVAIGVTVLWQPLLALGAYAVLGVVVLALRLVAPDAEVAPSMEHVAIEGANDADLPALAKAA